MSRHMPKTQTFKHLQNQVVPTIKVQLVSLLDNPNVSTSWHRYHCASLDLYSFDTCFDHHLSFQCSIGPLFPRTHRVCYDIVLTIAQMWLTCSIWPPQRQVTIPISIPCRQAAYIHLITTLLLAILALITDHPAIINLIT